MANPTAVPGTVVPSGALLTPSGGQGYLGIRGAPGPATVSTDSGNAATLGSDSRIFVPPIALADNTQNGLLRQVSGSTRDLVDGTNNCVDVGARTSWRKRYYYAWHCDHPPSATQYIQAGGSGSGVTQVASQANHPGIYQLLANGTASTFFASYASNSVADIQLGFFTKLAFRCVFNANNLGPFVGQGGSWSMGFVDVLNTIAPTNGMWLAYTNTTGGAGIYGIYTNNGGTPANRYSPLPTFSDGNWWDVTLYWDSNGLKMRLGYWNGTSVPVSPTPVLYGPFTTGLPATTVNLFWEIKCKVAPIGSAGPASGLIDLVEIAGEYATPGGFRGEELVTSF
jgi:hypothetical protein